TVAAALLADDEQQADARLSLRAEPVDGGDLRRENSLGVAGAPAVQPIALDAAGEKRRHTIEVRGEHHRRRGDSGEKVEPLAVDRLFDDVEAVIAEESREPS